MSGLEECAGNVIAFPAAARAATGAAQAILPGGAMQAPRPADGRMARKAKPEGARARTGADHRAGHRERLRERFRRAGSEGLNDYELLELVLFQAIPRKDVKKLAKTLIARFGGFAEVIGAPHELLAEVDGVGKAAALQLKIVQAAAQKLVGTQARRKPVIANWQALLNHCTAAMAHEAEEQFRVLFLDRKNALIADEVMQRGTVDHTPVYPREVVRRAIELRASAIILAHNHPSGDPTPSRADIDMTKRVVEAAGAVEIRVHDHLIIGKGLTASFRSLGLL